MHTQIQTTSESVAMKRLTSVTLSMTLPPEKFLKMRLLRRLLVRHLLCRLYSARRRGYGEVRREGPPQGQNEGPPQAAPRAERRGEKEDQSDQPVGKCELRRGILHELHELPRGFARSNGPMPTVERPVLGARRRGLPDGNDALLSSAILV